MPAFAAPEELQGKLDQAASTVYKPRGCLLFRQGEAVTGVYLVRRGTVSLGLGPSGPRMLTRKLGPGSLIGLPGTLSGKAYSLTAEVSDDAELGFVTRESFLQILRENPGLCFHVMDILSEEISGMRALMKPARTRSPRARKPV